MLEKKRRKSLLRKSGTAVCLVAAAAMAVGPTAAYAASGAAQQSAGSTAQLLEVGEEGYEYDISASETIAITGTEGNVYNGTALDPILMTDSANSGLNEYGKSTTRPDSNWFTYKYLVEYENNTNAGTASYTITGGADLGAPAWASKYTGVLKGTFEIAKADLAQAKAVALADGEKGVYLADGNAIAPKLKVALASHMGWTEDYSAQVEVPDYMATDDDWTCVYRDADGNVVDEVKTAGKYTVEAVAKSENVTGTSERVAFTVTSESIDVKDAVFGAIAAQQATGAAIEPELSVTVDGAALEKDIDYTVAYSNNVNVGTATATITGKGIYAGTASTTFEIEQADISAGADWSGNGFNVSVADLGQYDTHPYTGSEVKPPVTVVYKAGGHYDYTTWEQVFDITADLEEGKDFEVSYSNTTDVWLANNLYNKEDHDTLYPEEKHPTITITGKGNFKGEITKQFSITPAADISTAIIDNLPSCTFTGQAQALTVKQAGRKYVNLYNGMCAYGLENGEGTMFTTTYKDTDGNAIDADKIVNAGSYTMVVTGLESGGFTGAKEVPFSISAADFANVEIADIAPQTVSIDGAEPAPVPKATFTTGEGHAAKTYTLEAGEDFTVSYEGSSEDGAMRAILTPKGNFAGDARQVTFTVGEAAGLTMAAPVTWTDAATGTKDWSQHMSAAVTDGKVGIAKNSDGKYVVTLKPSNAMVGGIESPKETAIEKGEDGCYAIVVDDITAPLNVFVSVPMSPNGGYDTLMTLDLDNAEFALEGTNTYAADINLTQEDGTPSMASRYITGAVVGKSGDAYKAQLQLSDDAAGLITEINGDAEAPFVIDMPSLSDRVAVNFTIGAPMNATKTAYLSLALSDSVAADVAAAKQVAADKAAADEAIEAIEAAEKSGTEADVAAARAKVDALSDGAAALVKEAGALSKLEAAEKAIADAKKAAEEAAAKKAAEEAAAKKAAEQAQQQAAAVTEVTINVKKVTPAAVKKALGANAATVTKVTLGKKVKKVSAKAFKGTKVTTLVVKTKKLTKKSVKGALKGSKVKTVKVPKAKKKAYKKIFVKKVCGAKVKVK